MVCDRVLGLRPRKPAQSALCGSVTGRAESVRLGRETAKDQAMAWRRMVLQIGMGTDIRGADYTKAAVRALRDALWHNSLSVAQAAGLDVDSMRVEVTIGVPRPEAVDKTAVLAVLPHGTGTVEVVAGGLEIPNDAGTGKTVVANAAAVVRLDIAEGSGR
jgi:uncharacterized protein (TIGR02058 family)